MPFFGIAVDDPGNLRAAHSDIGEGMVVERHQLGLRRAPSPSLRDGAPGRNDELHERHGDHSADIDYGALQQLTLQRKIGAPPAADQPCRKIKGGGGAIAARGLSRRSEPPYYLCKIHHVS
jgi:hypothetical protein